MKVLVTGAETAVGRALIEGLLAAPDVERVLAIGEPGACELDAHKKLVYRSVDLTHERATHDVIWGDARDLAIDAVVHTCVAGTRALVLACMTHSTIRRFVYRSFADVYAPCQPGSNVIDEDAPIEFAPGRLLRDRVAADLTVCEHLGGPLSIAVLRCAEILMPGERLWAYFHARVCLRPLGFDPMVNLLSPEDAVAALGCALRGTATGVFNIPGFDTLPLSLAIQASRRIDVPSLGMRVSFAGVLDGTRAHAQLGFVPKHPVTWPQAWWQQLLGRLGEIYDESRG